MSINKEEQGPKALVAVDSSEHSERAVILSGRFARITGVKLTLLNVIEDTKRHMELPDSEPYKLKIEKAKELLDRFKKIAEENGAQDVQTAVAIGPVADEIVRIGEEESYDYIVLGTRGMGGFKRFLLGSVAEKVILNAHRPVVVTRIIGKEERAPRLKEDGLKLLVVVDGSDVSEKAVLVTSQFAGKADVHVTLLHVLEDVIHYDEIPDTYVYRLREEEGKKILEKAKRIAQAVDMEDVDTMITVGPVDEEINRVGKDYVSIVLGLKQRDIFKKLLSTAPRPLVIIR